MAPAFRYGFDLPPDERRLLRGALPSSVREWVRRQVGNGARIVSEHARSGGTASAVHAVTVDDAAGNRRHLILRRYVRADWLAQQPDLAEHEARVLELLAPTAVDAPRLVAVDPAGEECDVPAVLMTRLPGRVRWSPRDVDGFITRLVEAMLVVHAVPVPTGVAIRPFRPYDGGRDLTPPAGTTVPEAWRRAIEVHAGRAPSHDAVLVHRDFHPGNVLWSGSEVSAIVDWSSASVGAPEVDVAHCRVNLAVALGLDAADRFLAIYQQRTGRDEYDPYWDLQDLVGMISHIELEPEWLPADDELVRRAVARLGRATR
jgi:aminoglycoside phosphotransferase (APT) family kinase protein